MTLYKDLLGHNLEKFGMVTVYDATFYDENDVPLLTLDTLTVSNISTESSQKEIRGGQSSAILISYDYGKTATVEITDALASMYSLKYLWGAQLTSGNITALIKREKTLKAAVSPATMAFEAPGRVVGKPVTILLKYANGKEEYLTAENSIPAVPEDAKAGDKYVIYYTAEYVQGAGDNVYNSHVNQLTLNINDFPKMMKLVGETFLIDQRTGKKVAMQIEFPKFKPNASFTFTLEAEGDASVFDFAGQAFPHNGDVVHLRTLGYLGEEENFFSQDNKDTDGTNPEDQTDTETPPFKD